MAMEVLELLLSLVAVGTCSLLLYLGNIFWLRPRKALRRLGEQGITGPPPSFFYGNVQEMRRLVSAREVERKEKTVAAAQGCDGRPLGGVERLTQDYASTVFPYFEHWRKAYGPVFMYSIGYKPALYVSNPDLVRDISLCVSLDLGKGTNAKKALEPLFGDSIIKSNGLTWANQRKIIAPQLFAERVKGMVDLIVESANPLLKSWEVKVDGEGGIADIHVDDDLRGFSADVISRACFGSSYSEGKDIFSRLRTLQNALSKPSVLFGIHHLRFLPTKNNLKIGRLVRETRLLILNIVNERKVQSKVSTDLLQSIVENAGASFKSPYAANSFIVDNCKTIYFAGHDTTSVTATWCLMLLASHSEWQTRARAEVMEVCGGRLPDCEMLPKMKFLTMVIQETLRLYPPAPFVSRETLQDMKFGDLMIPKGTDVWIDVSAMHHDQAIWGLDVNEFNPKRFACGISDSCKFPQAYIPFGIGARKCVGQNMAMVELKVVLSVILSKFNFSLSPKYRHSPAFRLTIAPEYGLQLVVKRL